MEPAVKKRSVVVGGHKTSTSLENEFWEALREIAQSQQMSLSKLLAAIKAEQRQNSLSSAIRVFVLNHYRKPSYSTRYRKAKASKGLTGSFGDRSWPRKAII